MVLRDEGIDRQIMRNKSAITVVKKSPYDKEQYGSWISGSTGQVSE